MKLLQKNKFVLFWVILGIVFLWYSYFLCINYNEKWFSAFMQIGYIFITLTAMVLVMLHTFSVANESAGKQIEIYREESLKQIQAISNSTQSQIEHIKVNTKEQITAIQKASQEQTNAIQASTEKQIEHLNKITQEQINSYQIESEKQIKNLQNATEKQVNSFIEQTNSIVDRLEKLGTAMSDLTELNKEMLENEKELRELEEEKFRKREDELRKNYLDKLESIERIRPDFHFRTEVDSYFIVFNYIYFYLYNSGGDARSLVVNISLKKSDTNESTRVTSKTFYNVGRMKQLSFKWLRAKHFKDYDKIVIEISTRDLQHREYYGHWLFERNDNVWIKIDANERAQLGTGNNSNYLSI